MSHLKNEVTEETLQKVLMLSRKFEAIDFMTRTVKWMAAFTAGMVFAACMTTDKEFVRTMVAIGAIMIAVLFIIARIIPRLWIKYHEQLHDCYPYEAMNWKRGHELYDRIIDGKTHFKNTKALLSYMR